MPEPTPPSTPDPVAPITVAYEAMGDRLVIQRDEAIRTTSAGIHLPGASQERPLCGTVVAVPLHPIAYTPSGVPLLSKFSVGDRVMFSSYAGSEVSFNGVTLTVMQEADILLRFRTVRTPSDELPPSDHIRGDSPA